MCHIFTTRRPCQRLLESSDNLEMLFLRKGFIPFSWQPCNLPSYPNYVTPKGGGGGGGGGEIKDKHIFVRFTSVKLKSPFRLTVVV